MANRKKKFISQEYSASGQGRNIKEGTQKSRFSLVFSASFFGLSVLIGIAMIAFSIVFLYSDVNGSSMMNVLNPEFFEKNIPGEGNSTDSVIVNKFKKPTRGDIVIVTPNVDNPFASNDPDAMDYKHVRHIKRVLAIGGDTVSFQENLDDDPDSLDHFTIMINGIPETEIDFKFQELDAYRGQNIYDPETNHELVDHHYESVIKALKNPDSIQYGLEWIKDFIHKDEKGGYVVNDLGLHELLIPNDYIFYVGDNRGGSRTGLDGLYMSRGDCMWIGPQPTYKIIGTVTEVMHHNSAPKWLWDKFVYYITFQWL